MRTIYPKIFATFDLFATMCQIGAAFSAPKVF